MDSRRSSVKNIRTTHAGSTNETVEADEVPSDVHNITTTHSDADSRPRQEAQTS